MKMSQLVQQLSVHPTYNIWRELSEIVLSRLVVVTPSDEGVTTQQLAAVSSPAVSSPIESAIISEGVLAAASFVKDNESRQNYL